MVSSCDLIVSRGFSTAPGSTANPCASSASSDWQPNDVGSELAVAFDGPGLSIAPPPTPLALTVEFPSPTATMLIEPVVLIVPPLVVVATAGAAVAVASDPMAFTTPPEAA